jgi:ABC-type lipoprotein export system ATPase subunit
VSIIEGRGIRKTYEIGDQTIRALDGVDLDIPHGQFIAIMGPSGSGKSTLLYLLGGLDQMDEGDIMVDGHNISHLNSKERARFRSTTVGFIFQSFNLLPMQTALENVALPGIFAGMPIDQREERAYYLLNNLGLGDRIDHRPSQLSGGQQQRVAIARALFNDPPVIMADEPTGALYSKMGERVMKMLRALCSEQGKTIVLVTHDPGAANFADRLLHLKDGRIEGDEYPAPQELQFYEPAV